MSEPQSVNVIADIAGRYDEFMELLSKMPAASLTLAVGDLIDRGPKSRQVIEWFMEDPHLRDSVLGNHELMAIEAHENFGDPMWHPYWSYNGGRETMNSYDWQRMPEEHLKWLKALPAWHRQDGLFVSHAPVMDVKAPLPKRWGYDWAEWTEDESSWPWNRYLSAQPMPDHFMLYGHNSHFVEHQYIDAEGKMLHYATCLDNSRNKSLIGMHWPSKELFQVEYR